MKYIMIEARLSKENADDMTVLIPVMFSKLLVHREMYEIVHMQLRRNKDQQFGDIKCVGAGFVDSVLGGYKCYGESESLNKASRGDLDSDVLNQMRYAHGIAYMQTLESTLEEFFSPLGFVKPMIKRTDGADEVFAATANATKTAYELRQIHSNGFRFGAITRGRSVASGDVLTMPLGLKFDYVGPMSTVNYNGVSHLLRLAGTHELVEIPNELIEHMIPCAMTIDTCMRAIDEAIPFDLNKVIKDLNVHIALGEGHRFAGDPAERPEHIGVVILTKMTMTREQQDTMLSGDGHAVAQLHVEVVKNKTPFVVTMRVRDFHNRVAKCVEWP